MVTVYGYGFAGTENILPGAPQDDSGGPWNNDMKVFPRIFLAAALALFVGPSCLVTNILGIEPLGGIKGEEARERIMSIVQVNFFLGVYSYCSQFDPIDTCLDESLVASVSGSVAAGLLAVSRIDNLEDEDFYTVESVSNCLRDAGYTVNLATFSILDGKKTCDFVGCSPAPAASVTNAGFTTGLLGGGLCELEKTGNVISIGNVNFGLPLPEPLD